MKTIAGIVPIVAAVFDDRGRVDLEGFARLVRHLTGTGAKALTLFGLATEFYKLTDEEKERMMRVLLAETSASPDVAGIVSITHHSWEVAAVQAQQAEQAGADALMLLPPFFLAPSADAILAHARKVAQAVSIPVIVQYAPNQTGVRIEPELFVRLREDCPNARYVKVETQPPGKFAARLHELSGGSVETLVGYAGVQMIDVLQRGSVGIQPGCSFTEVYVALYGMFRRGELDELNALFGRLLPYISYWMQSVELIIKAEKAILHKRGLIASSYCRQPDYRLDAFEERMIDAFLQEFVAYWGK
ncbi:MAG: dihydrodipicolinate synthase family protein [Paenibacillaceae bacterium]|nr:dihydrodipicolinate synthase family protein [Paenibacillaceae bacterium]